MVMLKNVALAASLLAPLALAIPMLDARRIRTHFVTEYDVITVEETVTVWVNPTEATPASVSSVDTPSAEVPAVFAQPTYIPSSMATVAAAAPTEAAPAASPPTPAVAVAAPSSSAPAVAVAAPAPAAQPAVSSPAAVPAAAPAVSSPAAAPAAASSSPAAAPVSMQPKSASDSGTCEGSADGCVGDVTHWDGGLGACGWNVDTSSEMQIALPFAFMGTQSNGNPYCGRSVTLYNPTSGTTVQATVGDKCMGCTGRAIDCTDALFSAITDGKGDGRVSGIQWWFN